jgi:autoinducer 2 (AI-2) kinase
MGVSLDQAPLVQSGTFVGMVRADMAERTGLAPGTPVAAAGADTQCGLLGMGVVEPHQVGIVAGWSAPVQMVTDEPLFPPEAATWTGCFLEAGKWVMESSAGDVGNSYRWLAETIFGDAAGAFDRMDDLAAAAPLGSDGAMAVLGPSRMNMASPGMSMGGFLFPVPLTFSPLGRGHMVRAAIEAIACALRANLEQVEGLTGVRASEVVVGGGMTRTITFVSVLSNVLGRETKLLPVPEATALGAYLCARTAQGEFGSLTEAAESVRPSLDVKQPDAVDAAEYQDHYERWLDVCERLEGVDL